MSQLCIASGIEFVPFTWDQLPAFVRGANRGAATPPPAYLALHRSATPQRVENAAMEEEPERWDGLS
jgi:hypothetical protein